MHNRNYIIKTISAVMMLVGLAMLLPAGVSLYYGEESSVRAFAVCALPMAVVGFAMQKYIPESGRALRMRDGLLIGALSWLLMSALGCLPFTIEGCIPGFADAFFETSSGFSTTGASILTAIESLPKGMLLWRSLTHWLGGMGILVLTIALFPMLGIGGQRVMRAETTGPTMDKTNFTLRESASSLYKIYTLFTVAEIALLMAGGMSLYDAAIHSFGTVGTGGFSNYSASVAQFGSVYIELVIVVFMLACGVNFGIYHRVIFGRKLSALRDPELKTYLSIVAVSTLFIAGCLYLNGLTSPGEGLRQSVFQVSSVITTTGYATADFALWPLPARIVLFMLMIIGSCASSTGGGIKVIRLIFAWKVMRRGVRRRLHPDSVEPIKLGGRSVSEEAVSSTVTFLFLYIVTAAVGIFLLSFENTDFETCISSVIACLSNIGPGFGLVGPMGNYAFYSDAAKIVLALIMIAGRIELYAILLPLSPRFWNPAR